MICFIDTNIFIRVLTKDDPKKFKDCLELLRLVKTNKIDAVTSSIVKSEIEWVLRSLYKVEKSDLVKYLQYIENLSGIFCVNTIWDRAAIDSYTSHSVKYVDSQIASIPEIKKKEWTMVSYDRDFDKLKVKRLEPREVVKKFSN